MGLFPGSRATEVNRLWPVLRDAAAIVVEAIPELRVAVATLPGLSYPGADRIGAVKAPSATVMVASDAAIVKSGTATLEAALADTPSVITYRTDALSYGLARRLVRCEHVGLVNLVAGRRVVPEVLQRAATPSALAALVLPLLDPHGDDARRQRQAFAEVRPRLGIPGAANRVAELTMELMSW